MAHDDNDDVGDGDDMTWFKSTAYTKIYSPQQNEHKLHSLTHHILNLVCVNEMVSSRYHLTRTCTLTHYSISFSTLIFGIWKSATPGYKIFGTANFMECESSWADYEPERERQIEGDIETKWGWASESSARYTAIIARGFLLLIFIISNERNKMVFLASFLFAYFSLSFLFCGE